MVDFINKTDAWDTIFSSLAPNSFRLSLDKAKKARAILVEEAVSADEDLMNKYFNQGEEAITEAELKSALRKRVLDGDFFLVTGGDGRGVIVEKVLDLCVDYLPSPLLSYMQYTGKR